MKPSDYYPGEFYREPPEDPRSQEASGRAPGQAARLEASRFVRHEGYGKHFHIPRSQQADAHHRLDWET